MTSFALISVPSGALCTSGVICISGSYTLRPHQVLRWLESCPSLPLVPLSGPGAVPLPSSAPPLAAACPVAGLWGWAVLSAALRPPTEAEDGDHMARLHLLLLTCLLVGSGGAERIGVLTRLSGALPV